MNIRACKGFDGGFELRIAIRGPFRVPNGNLNINADNKLAFAA